MPDLYEQIDAAVMAALHEAIGETIHGNSTGEIRGFLAAAGLPAEPTPVERAFAILDPHLRACPLYKAGPPVLYRF